MRPRTSLCIVARTLWTIRTVSVTELSKKRTTGRKRFWLDANGFRISDKHAAILSYRNDAPPIKTMRLIAQRETRLEPITYWMRVGNDISNGVVENQLSRLKYGLRGVIPDGALMRVSTIGVSSEASFKLQDEFIHDLLAAIPSQELKFFTGTS